jgi:hypothetical protein
MRRSARYRSTHFEFAQGCNALRNGSIIGKAYEIDLHGHVPTPDKSGLGLEIDEDFIKAHPVIEEPGFV